MEYKHDKKCTCPGCLSWDPFDEIYIEFAMECSQQILTYTLAHEALANFPANMPRHILDPIMAKKLVESDDELRRRGIKPIYPLSEDPDEDRIREAADTVLTPEQERIRYAFNGVYAVARYGKKIPEFKYPDFERVLIKQNVVTICSFAEGFISNTIRFLCPICPDPYNNWEKRQRRQRLPEEETDRLERYIYEMGFGSINKKIERIETEYDIQISASESQRNKVGELFLIRNCIVHNAGLVSKAYKESGKAPNNLNVGDELDLTEQATEVLIDALIDVVTDVYRSISLQILKKPLERLMFGPLQV